MNQDEIRNLAIECGAMIIGMDDTTQCFKDEIIFSNDKELEAYTAAVEAPLQAMISQLEEAIGDIQNYSHKPDFVLRQCEQALAESPSTWLSEHDKEVEARERERCAMVCQGQGLAMEPMDLADLIRELK